MPGFPAGRRDQTVSVLQRAKDEAGRPTGQFAVAFARFAAVYAKGGGQGVEAGAAVAGTLYEMVLPDDRETRSIAVTDRIRWRGREMDVIRADMPDRLRMTITIAVRDERGG